MDPIYGRTEDFVFRDAVKFLRKKKVLPKEAYELLDAESRAKAFSVSGYASLAVLQEFLDELQAAAKDGTTKEAFRERMDSFLEKHGYEGMNPQRSATIFQTNLQTAMNAGHYRSMSEPAVRKLRPYWMYRTAGDGRVRESHMMMEGRVYRADDPIWNVWYPPNGFNCRCTVVSLSPRQVEARGLRVDQDPPARLDTATGELAPVFPDKGFSNNPAKDAWKPDLSGIHPALKKAYRERGEAGNSTKR